MTGQERVGWAWLFVPVILTATGVFVAVSCFRSGSYTITQGPKRGPPTRVWTYTGADATRVGWGGVATSAAGLLLLVNAVLAGRTTWARRPRLLAGLACFSAAVLLFFPPWQLSYRGTVAAFYAFLIPALTGLLLGRNCGIFILSILAGIVLAAVVGRENLFNGMMPAVLALLAIGGHLGRLTNGWFRRELDRAGLPR